MRRQGVWYFYTLVSSLVLLVSSAPSEKREKGSEQSTKSTEVKQLLQVEPNNLMTGNSDGEGNQWYPTIDLSKDDLTDFDYTFETATEAQRKAKSTPKPTIKTEEPKKFTTSKPSFKIFCEGGGKTGNCSGSKQQESSTAKIQVPSTDGEQSLNGLIVRINEMIHKSERLENNKVKQLRQLVAVVAKKADELQRNGGATEKIKSKKVGGKDYNSQSSTYVNQANFPPVRGQIAEIEEKLIVEREIMKAKDHQKQHVTSDIENPMKTAAEKQTTKAPAKTTSSSTTMKRLDEKTSTTYRPQVPPVPAPPQIENVVKAESSVESSKPASVNYFALPADINYNGGINRHMDDLKSHYPEGHWPDEEGDDDYIVEKEADSLPESDVSEGDPGNPDGNMAVTYYDDYDDGLQEKVQDFKDLNLITPEYLENIIQQEREQSPTKKNNGTKSSSHHVQEHKLPDKKRSEANEVLNMWF